MVSDSRKIKIFIFWKKGGDLRLFLVVKRGKTYKKYFSHQPILERNGFLNRGPFAEVESTIRPFPLVQLIESAVAPLLDRLQHRPDVSTTLVDYSVNKSKQTRDDQMLV